MLRRNGSASAHHQSRRSRAALLPWLALAAERVGSVVVTAATAKKHQSHEAAPDQQRKECAKAKRDRAVLTQIGAAAGIPDRDSPDAGDDEEDHRTTNKMIWPAPMRSSVFPFQVHIDEPRQREAVPVEGRVCPLSRDPDPRES
jgi:hypothetical protein